MVDVKKKNDDDAPLRVLRYPGCKRHMIPMLDEVTPKGVPVHSPFFGSGSFELHLMRVHGTRVYANDVDVNIAAFWRCMKNDADRESVLSFARSFVQPLTKGDFSRLRQDLLAPIEDDVTRASKFYLLNRASFNGGSLSAGFSEYNAQRIPKALETLSRPCFPTCMKSLCGVSCLDYKTYLRGLDPSAFLFLDPPYAIEHSDLYGNRGSNHRRFDHEELREVLRRHDRWIMTYNDCDRIRGLYEGDCDVRPYRSGASKKEILIISPAYAAELNQT